MKKVFSFWKKASVVAMDSPTSGAKACPTSEAKVSPTSGAKVSSTSRTKISITSGAKVCPTSGAMVSPTSQTMVSPTSQTKVCPTSGAKVSPTSGAKVSHTSGAKVSPTSQTMVSPSSEAKVSHTSEAKVSPTSGAKVSHTSGAMVSHTSEAKVSPTSQTMVSHTSGAKVSPTSQTMVSPTSEAKISHTSEAKVPHTSEAKVSPTSGAKACPTSRTKISITSGAKVCPTSGAMVSPTSQTMVSHTSGAKVYPTTSQTKVCPTSRTKVSSTSQTKISITSGTKVCPTSGAKVSPTSGAKVSHTSEAKVSPTSGAKVSPTSGAKVSPTSGAKVSPISGAKVSHTSGAKLSPTSPAMVSPTSQGSSGMEARRPNFRDKDMNAIHKAAKEGNRWRVKQILFFGISDLNARDKMSRTALHVACAYGRPRMVRLLIKRQCLLDLSDIEKKTALIHALQYQSTKCATLLLDSGADPNIMDHDGNTALHYAVLGHNKAIVEKLLSCKANIEVRNKSDLTPLALAKLANNEKMVELLVSRGAKDHQRKQQLTSEYEDKRRLRTSQSSNRVDGIPAEGSLNRVLLPSMSFHKITVGELPKNMLFKQQLTSKYKEGKKPPKSESSNLATDLQESPKSAQTKTKSKTVDEISAEGSLNSKQQLTSEYQERRRPHTSESTHHATDLQESPKSAQTKTKSKTVDEISAEGSLNSKQQLTSEYEEGRTQTLESSLFVEDISEEEDSLSSNQQLTSEYQEISRPHTSESTHRVDIDLRHTRKQAWTKAKSKRVDEISEKDSLSRLSSKSGIDDAWPTSHNEDFKEKVISETHTRTAKTSKNQSKRIHLSPLHLKKMTQESQIKRASDKEDTSAYSGHPSVQKDEEMCIKQGTLEQRKNLQLFKDESKQKPHEFSVKLKMTECPEEEPPRDNSKGGASLRQMPSNLTSKMLDCEGKDAFGMSVSAALQTFPGLEEPTLKIVPPSHADPGSPEVSPSSSSSELRLRGKELHFENDHQPDAEHVNKKEKSFYNNTENRKVRHPIVTSEVREDQEFAMQMTRNMNPNTTERKLGIGPTPQSSDPKSHFDLWLVGCNETKPMIELKSQDMPAVTNTYAEIKPNQDLFQKPVCADNCSTNYCKSMDSKLKDEHSSALHNDRTPGVHVTEKDLQRHKNNIDMVKVEYLAWKRKKIPLQKEVEGKKKQKSSKREASGNMYEGADDDSDSIGLSQQSNSEHTDNQQTSDEINENTVIFVNKAEENKEQKTSKREVSGNMDGADGSDSVELSQQSNSEQTDKQQVSIMEDEDSDRFTLEEEKEKRQNVDLLYEKNRVKSRKKEEHSIKEVQMKPYLETTIRKLDIISETVRENKVVEERNYTQSQLSKEQNARILQDGILTKHLCKPKEIEITHEKMNYKVSEGSDKEKSLLHENCMLWDEIAKLRLDIETIKTQTQEMGEKYIEDIAIVKERNDCLEKTIRKTVFQHNAQLDVLKAELIMLNSKLENEQQNRGRLEAEVESYQSILVTAVQDHEHCQTSKRDLQLAFKRARDEWFCVWDKMNFDMSNLKQNNEILSQQLSKAESKINNLEIELHHTRDALKERTLVLERDLSQKQCQQEETEHVYQEEQGKMDEDIGKQESLQEKLSDLQSENNLLRQKLHQAHNKADGEEKTVMNIQDQIQDKISIFNAESVKQIIMLNERINELTNEWHHFKERIHQYENDNVERDAIVRQLQEELAVVRQLQQEISGREASLEVDSHHPVLLQDKTHDLKKDLDQSRSQSQHEKEESNKYINLDDCLRQRLQQVMNKKDDLEKDVTRLNELLKVTKKKLNECDNEELSFPGDSKPSSADIEIQSKKRKQKNDELIAKLKPASSKCIRLDEEKTPQQQLVEAFLKECEELKNAAEMWEQETVNLRTYMEMNMVESCEVEEYKKKIEERARQDVADKFKQVNSFLQTLRESQEMSEQMMNIQASLRRPLELRNKELESELSRVQTSRDDSKRELEKYRRLYQEQLERRKFLENQLTDFHRTKERLAEVSTKLLLEEQQNRLLRSAPKTRPDLEAPCAGNRSNSFVPRRHSTPRENLDSPTSRSYTLTYRKMWQEYEEILTTELKEDAAKFEAESYTACHVPSIYQSSSYQDLLLKAQQEYKEILLKNYKV